MLKIGPKKLWGALEDQKRAGSKNFWCNLGKALGPPSGHPRKFLIHAQSWLKSAVQFPLNRNFTYPKLPPLRAKRVFFISGYLRVMYCPPWPSLVQIWQPPSVRSVSLTAGIPVKEMDIFLAFWVHIGHKPNIWLYWRTIQHLNAFIGANVHAFPNYQTCW